MVGTIRMSVWGVIAGLTVALLVEACHIELFGNFHTIIPGRAYRCGQPSAACLEKLIGERHIRTVINLRGGQAPAPWYMDECRVTSSHDVSQEDVCLSAGRMPSIHEIKRLIDVLDHCEYPVLFHCQRGADRTGLASCVLLLTHTDATLAEARHQLGPRYGHLCVGKTGQLDRFIDLYEDWLKKNGLEHDHGNFIRWLDEGFCEYAASLEVIDRPAAILASEPALFVVRAHNVSTRPWRFQSGRNSGFHAFYAIHGPSNEIVHQGRAGLYETTVQPGEAIDLKVVVPPMKRPGRYRMLIDMTDEQYCLFYQIGSEPLIVELDVK